MTADLRTLYERDFYAWSRLQARELLRLKGLRLNTGLDLDHLAWSFAIWAASSCSRSRARPCG